MMTVMRHTCHHLEEFQTEEEAKENERSPSDALLCCHTVCRSIEKGHGA